jgi:phage shock protein B
MQELTSLIAVISIFIIMPAMFFVHHLIKWKTGSSLSRDDETMLEELYQVARRLDERLETVERLVAADNPDFKPERIRTDLDIANQALDELDRLRAHKERTAR